MLDLPLTVQPSLEIDDVRFPSDFAPEVVKDLIARNMDRLRRTCDEVRMMCDLVLSFNINKRSEDERAFVVF